MNEFDSLGVRQEPVENDAIDTTFDDKEVYPGDSVIELNGDLIFDDEDSLRRYVLSAGGIRRVIE